MSIPPLVTVVTATYNLIHAGRLAHFHQCLESVQKQTYGNIEHLVIDGASSDGTRGVLAEYVQRGWIRVHSEPDSGIYEAMNRGLKLAQGEYIAFLNSDDYWHDPHGVEASVSALELSGACFSYAAHRVIDCKGKHVRTQEPNIAKIFFEMSFCHQTMFCRTEALRRIGGFEDKVYRYTADYEAVLRLLLQGERCVQIPMNFTTFREGGPSSDPALARNVMGEWGKVHSRIYTPLAGEEAAEKMRSFTLSISLYKKLHQMVHPSLMEQLTASCRFDSETAQGSFHRWAEDVVQLRLFREQAMLEPAPAPAGNGTLDSRPEGGSLPCTAPHTWRRCYRLFGFIPLLTIKTSVKENGMVRQCSLLFGFLPIMSSKCSWRRVG